MRRHNEHDDISALSLAAKLWVDGIDEQEESIKKLKRSIEDAKHLQADMQQQSADLSKLIKEAQSIKHKTRKPKRSRP